MLNDSHPIQKHAMYQVTYLCDLHVQSTVHEFIINYFVKWFSIAQSKQHHGQSNEQSLAFGEQYPRQYIYMFCANLIYFISITCRVYFPTSLRVVHLEVRNFVLRQVTKHATWRQGKANGTECWWKQKSNTGWFDDLWLRIWNAQGFLKDLFNIFLLGQERWWKEKPTLGLRMINGGST